MPMSQLVYQIPLVPENNSYEYKLETKIHSMENLESNPSKLDSNNKWKEGIVRFLYEEQSN